jgi:soluble lytic murein transglycosylase-like protein
MADLLVMAIEQVESAGNPRCVGKSGERGLMQIKHATWRETTHWMFGEPLGFHRAFEPDMNRRVGRAYLARLQRLLGERRSEWRADERALLLACYNAGPGCVERAGFDLSRIPARTRDYVKRVSALHDHYRREEQARVANARREAESADRPIRVARAAL